MSEFTIHGARGSHPVSGVSYTRYGGHTSCYSLETKEGLLIIDAGSGIIPLGEKLAVRSKIPPITLLFTHFHLDHLIGLPAFKPFLRTDADVTLIGNTNNLKSWKEILLQLTSMPLWPIRSLRDKAKVRFESLPAPRSARTRPKLERYGIAISWCALNHPQGCLGYRLEDGRRSIVIGTDREHGNAAMDRAFLEFSREADVLIHDAQFTPEEYPERKLWGHSTWRVSASVASSARVKQLILTSHDPLRRDDDVDRLINQAQKVFPNTSGAQEQMVVTRLSSEHKENQHAVASRRRR